MSETRLAYRQSVKIEGYKVEMMIVPRLRRAVPVITGIDYPAEITALDGNSTEYLSAVLHATDAAEERGCDAFTSTYVPEDVPDLYLKFSRVPTTVEGILAFANRYGLIGVTEQIPFDEADGDGHVWRDYLYVECAHVWAREIQKMRRAIEVYDLLNQPLGPDRKSLERIFFYRHDDWQINLDYLPGERRLEDDYEPLRLWADEDLSVYPIPRAKVATVAEEYLRITVDRELRGRVRASVSRDGGNMVLLYRPTSLLGVMWLQLAKVLTGTDNTRACLECGKPFEFQRRTRLFCGENCQKNYNRKKLRAARKAAEVDCSDS